LLVHIHITVKNSFTLLLASVPKLSSHHKETDRTVCFEDTVLKRIFRLGLQNKGLSRVCCVTGKVEIQMCSKFYSKIPRKVIHMEHTCRD
jgi:hypothetical protein